MTIVCGNDVLIFPHKHLLRHREEFEGNYSTAVLCSSKPLKDTDFDWIQRRLILKFVDTLADRMDAYQPEQAKAVADFLNEAEPDEVVIFCCDSGISRSSALAAAFLRSRDKDEMEIWANPRFSPNSLVYRLQCQAFGIAVTEKEIRERVRINEEALIVAAQK